MGGIEVDGNKDAKGASFTCMRQQVKKDKGNVATSSVRGIVRLILFIFFSDFTSKGAHLFVHHTELELLINIWGLGSE